jgi:hypothetical protein
MQDCGLVKLLLIIREALMTKVSNVFFWLILKLSNYSALSMR